MFPTFSSHNASTTTLNMSDITAATVGEKTPAATPTARARKMYTASFVSLRVLRNRTAATMAASVNARARLFWTRRSEEHTSELQSLRHLVCRLLLEKKKKKRR